MFVIKDKVCLTFCLTKRVKVMKNMRLKKEESYMINKVTIRCTDKEKNQLQVMANIYCEGNLSEFVRFCVLNYEIKLEDLQENLGKKKPPISRRLTHGENE
jgi:hypothetical protein